MIIVYNAVYAVERQDIRIGACLDLFPSILAADINIDEKKGPDGSLLLVLLYTNDREKAKKMADYLGKVNHIRDIPIRIEISDIQALNQLNPQVTAGLFLTQPLTSNLDALIEFGREHKIIVFSPFEGDVERGVLAGIHISNRLLPYINIAALRASKITIKPFFLRISERYKEE